MILHVITWAALIAACFYYERRLMKISEVQKWFVSESWVRTKLESTKGDMTRRSDSVKRDIEDEIRESNKMIPERMLEAFGGRVHKCYTKEGTLSTVTVIAPWLSEPLKESVIMGEGTAIGQSLAILGSSLNPSKKKN